MSSARSENTQTNVYLESTSLVWYVIGKSPGADSDPSGAFFRSWMLCGSETEEHVYRGNQRKTILLLLGICATFSVSPGIYKEDDIILPTIWLHLLLKHSPKKAPMHRLSYSQMMTHKSDSEWKRDLNWAFVRQLTTQINFSWCRTSWWEEEL